MKTIGFLGGMSWESTQLYYRAINETMRARLGGHHSAKIILHSVDFAEIDAMQRAGQWEKAGDFLGEAAAGLERAGADFIMIGANTMHLVADRVKRGTSLPLLHIVDVTGAAIKAAGHKTVGLLGTRFTMEQHFFRQHMQEKFGIEALIPGADARNEVHRIIYEELCMGKILGDSRTSYLGVIDGLKLRGATGIILGCTEIGLLIKQEQVDLPLFDTMALHAAAAVDMALA